MINKPVNAERESKAHAAVGRTLQSAGKTSDVAAKAAVTVGAGFSYWWIAMMGFGLLTSSTPWWFKGIGAAALYGLFKLFRSRRLKRMALLDARGATRDWTMR